MIRRQEGFTMVELLITMVIFVLTIAAASSVFVPLLTQFKQQSKIAESNIEGMVGLELLRRDLEQSGFGLPWSIPAAVTYQEGSSTTSGSLPAPNNALINDATANPPRAIASINSDTAPDYFVIKATSIAQNDACMKWTYVVSTGGGNRTVTSWSNSQEDLKTNPADRVIVLIPSRGAHSQRILVNNGSVFSAYFSSSSFPAEFSPATENDRYVVYGVDNYNASALRMPFNRADYYIRGGTGVTPAKCAPGTGVLMKAVINQADGNRGTEIPLLDCVADMQVVFRRDTDNDGTIDDETNDISALTAEEIRAQVREVRLYVLAHDGQRDATYTHCPTSAASCSTAVTVGDFGQGRDFDLTAITNWQNYRWKIYRMVVKPNNMES